MAEVSPRLITLEEATSPLSAKSSLWKFKARKPWTSRPVLLGGSSEKSLAVVGISNHYAEWQEMQNGAHTLSSPGKKQNGQASNTGESRSEGNFYYSGIESGEGECALHVELDRLERRSNSSPEPVGLDRGPEDGAYGLHDIQSMAEKDKRAFMQRLDSFRQRPGIGHFKDCPSFAPTLPLHGERSSVGSVHRAAHFQSPLVSLYTDGIITGELPAFRTWAATLSETPPLSDVTAPLDMSMSQGGEPPLAVVAVPIVPLADGVGLAVMADPQTTVVPQVVTVTTDTNGGVEAQQGAVEGDAGKGGSAGPQGEAGWKANGGDPPTERPRRRRGSFLLCCFGPGPSKRSRAGKGEGKAVIDGGKGQGGEEKGQRKKKEKKGKGELAVEASGQEPQEKSLDKGAKGKKGAKTHVRRLSDAVYAGEMKGIVMRGRSQAVAAQREDFTVISRSGSVNHSRRSSLSAGSITLGGLADSSSHGGAGAFDRRLSFGSDGSASNASDLIQLTSVSAAVAGNPSQHELNNSSNVDMIKLPGGAVVMANRPPLGPRHARKSSAGSADALAAAAGAGASNGLDLTRPQRQARESATMAVLASATAHTPSSGLHVRTSSAGSFTGMLPSVVIGGGHASTGSTRTSVSRSPVVLMPAYALSTSAAYPSPANVSAAGARIASRRSVSDGDLGALVGGVALAAAANGNSNSAIASKEGAGDGSGALSPLQGALPPVPCKVQGNPAFANLCILGQTVVNGELQVCGEMPPGTAECRFQWTRLRPGKGPGAPRVSEKIAGAVAPVYVPQLEDIGCYLYVSLAAVAQGGGLGAPAAAICGPITFSRRFASISRAGSMGSVGYASMGALVIPAPSSSSSPPKATGAAPAQHAAGLGNAFSLNAGAEDGGGGGRAGLRINTGSVSGAGSAAAAVAGSNQSSSHMGHGHGHGGASALPRAKNAHLGMSLKDIGGARPLGDADPSRTSIDLGTRSPLGMVSESDEEWSVPAPRGAPGSGGLDPDEWALGIGGGVMGIGRYTRQSWGGMPTTPQGSEAGSARGLDYHDVIGLDTSQLTVGGGGSGGKLSGASRDAHGVDGGQVGHGGADTGRVGSVGGDGPMVAPPSPNPEDLLRAASLGQLQPKGDATPLLAIGRYRWAGPADQEKEFAQDDRGVTEDGCGARLGQPGTPGFKSAKADPGASGARTLFDDEGHWPASGRLLGTDEDARRSDGDGDHPGKGAWTPDADVSAVGSASVADTERGAHGGGWEEEPTPRLGVAAHLVHELPAIGVGIRIGRGQSLRLAPAVPHASPTVLAAFEDVAGGAAQVGAAAAAHGAGDSGGMAADSSAVAVGSVMSGATDGTGTLSGVGVHGAVYAYANGSADAGRTAVVASAHHVVVADASADVSSETETGAGQGDDASKTTGAPSVGADADEAGSPAGVDSSACVEVAAAIVNSSSNHPSARRAGAGAAHVRPGPMRARNHAALKPVNRASHEAASPSYKAGAGARAKAADKAAKPPPAALTAAGKAKAKGPNSPRKASLASGAAKLTPRSNYLATNTTAGTKKYRQ